MSVRRCAIYTRKSTEEGLDQDFNSLHAQREACEAFIRSQRQEGWRILASKFDDGGYSGGTTERPALQRLLQAVEARQIDIVVVYKVDRLTRSLSDFARIIESFDAHQVSFVSVTQAFNTTTSMGRLTLNVLLSFAQFEREVTAERIRDKIAASKKKGMWMGGLPPLGYDVVEKQLKINHAEAETVRTLFRLYCELGTVRRLKQEADRRGLVTKRRSLKNRATGERPFTRGHLYQLLSNPIYMGRVAHKKETYRGQHEAIIDDDTWTAVQEQLARHATTRGSSTNARSPSLLSGLVFDERGDRLCPCHASKRGRRYRYYISKHLIHGADRQSEGWRLSAPEFEGFVVRSIRDLLHDERRLFDVLGLSESAATSYLQVRNTVKSAAKQLDASAGTRSRDVIRAMVQRVDLSLSTVSITLNRSGLRQILDIDQADMDLPDGEVATIALPTQLRRRGIETKIVIADPNHKQSSPDPQLCRLVATARACFERLASGSDPSVRALSRSFALHESEISRILPLAFLAPDIVEVILEGGQPVELTAERLKRLSKLPTDWSDQRRLLGFDG